jgi:hypothetical protein
MAISDETYTKLLERLTERVGRVRPCPVCGQDERYELLRSIANVSFVDSVHSMAVGDTYASHLLLVCTKCGNTNFLNVNVLGVYDLLAEEEQKSAGADPNA